MNKNEEVEKRNETLQKDVEHLKAASSIK